MPLDPTFQYVLAQLANAPQPSSLEESRAAAISGSALLPKRPVSIASARDLTYPGPASELVARLYTPHGDGPFPLTVYYHGGGFVAYSIDTHDALARELCAASGSMLLSVEYRLAPEHKFPAPLDDAYAALLWAADHAAELGADPSKLAVAGDSAGANLATAVALRARDESGPKLRAQLLLYPPVHLEDTDQYASQNENGEGFFLTLEQMRGLAGMYFEDPAHAAHPHASPITAELYNLPPALVLTAEFDPLRDEGVAYAEALSAAGNRAEHIGGPGMLHGFGNMTGLSGTAASLVDQAGAWLGRELK